MSPIHILSAAVLSYPQQCVPCEISFTETKQLHTSEEDASRI